MSLSLVLQRQAQIQQYTCLLHGRQQGHWQQQQQQAASCTQQGYLLQQVDEISAFLFYFR